MNRIAAVVIGRNEARKLPRSLSSVRGSAWPIVFVDSGSADASVDVARAMGADVVCLDDAEPFTVARARNAGFARVTQLDPGLQYVQFVDADSEITESWIALATQALAAQPDLAAVFGRLREREPHRSIYARLYQAEFDVQFGQRDVCGGMAMMRVDAVAQAGGFNTAMLGFEDFELSFRLRRAGWLVTRLDADMAVHEAAMNRASQWWRRQIRSGYARAQEATLHGQSPHRYGVRECRSIWFWGLLLPGAAIALTIVAGGPGALVLLGYPALVLRIMHRARQRGVRGVDAAVYAIGCVAGKFPQVGGLIRFHLEQVRRRLRLTPHHA